MTALLSTTIGALIGASIAMSFRRQKPGEAPLSRAEEKRADQELDDDDLFEDDQPGNMPADPATTSRVGRDSNRGRG